MESKNTPDESAWVSDDLLQRAQQADAVALVIEAAREGFVQGLQYQSWPGMTLSDRVNLLVTARGNTEAFKGDKAYLKRRFTQRWTPIDWVSR